MFNIEVVTVKHLILILPKMGANSMSPSFRGELISFYPTVLLTVARTLKQDDKSWLFCAQSM